MIVFYSIHIDLIQIRQHHAELSKVAGSNLSVGLK